MEPKKMKKSWLTVYLITTSSILFAQPVYTTQSGIISFFSKAPFTDISAKTNKAIASFNIQTSVIEAEIPMTEFNFEKSLMQKHFNERYMQSEQFPIASFKGKIQGKISTVVPDIHVVNAIGELLIHGVSRHREIQLTMMVNKDGSISVKTKFNVKLVDHNIEIPTLLFQPVTETVAVAADATLHHQEFEQITNQ
jgi:hypothetical protein